MAKPLKVLIHGDTLVMGCLRASLTSYEGLELTSIEAPAISEQELRLLGPDVIIFDLEAGQHAFQYSLVVQSPDLLLVGVDSTTNRVLTWSGRQLCQLSTAELVQVIEAATAGRAPAAPQARKARNDDEDLAGILEVLDRALADEGLRDGLSVAPRQAAAKAGWRFTRRHKLAFALVILVLGAGFVAVLLPGGVPLTGVAIGPVPAAVSLAFMTGLALGALALGVWTWERRK